MRRALAIALLLVAFETAAQDTTGNQLLTWCRAALAAEDTSNRSWSPAEAGRCQGWLRGMADGLDAAAAIASVRQKTGYEGYQRGRAFCVPDGVTFGQVTRMVVKHLESKPENLHQRAGVIISAYFIQQFPCPS